MTRAQQWAARAQESARIEAVELILPSGAQILARRPDAAQLAVWGRLPLQLAAALAKGETGEANEHSVDEGVELMKFYRELLTYVCVEPRISLAPSSDEEIHPSQIPQGDWQFLLRWAMRFEEGRKFEGFRGQRSSDSVGGDGEDVGGASIEPTGGDGPGHSTEF